jgi:GntR family transcriptional repressor for pyruvate dehydrogenase complex
MLRPARKVSRPVPAPGPGRGRRQPLSTHVVQQVLERIRSNGLQPGDQMASEVQIGRELGISRGSVREAYRSLAVLGILEIESGRRPRLRTVTPEFLTQVFTYALTTAQVSLAQVLETRRAIEVQNAQLAARFASPEQRAALRALAADMRAATDSEERRVACDAAIHTLIAESSGNPLSSLLLGSLQCSLEESARMHLTASRGDREIARVIEAHEAIVERIVAGDPVGAASAMSMHFDLSLVQVNHQQGAVGQAGVAP